MSAPPEDYRNTSVVTVQCPRCSQERDLPLITRATGSLEFAGVCSTPTANGGLCSTTLQLVVTAHLFPAA